MPSYAITRRKASHTAHVQEGRPFEVPAKSTLLMAALADGIDWPYGCRVGLCGRCRCKLLHGHVARLGDHSATLGASAVENGYILACRSLLDSNVLVLPPEQQGTAATEVTGTIAAHSRPTPEIIRLTIHLDQPYHTAYHAGQYARLTIPDVVPPRCFSYATACRGDDRLEFHVRLFPQGQLARWLTAQDRTGAAVRVSQPLGDIALDVRKMGQPLLFVAGGTGLSSVMAMLEELAAMASGPPPVTVLYAARDQSRLYDNERLRALAPAWTDASSLRFEAVLSREPEHGDWQGRRGHIFDHLDELLRERAAEHAFLSGPPGLVDATELALLKRGWPRTAITADRYLPAFD